MKLINPPLQPEGDLANPYYGKEMLSCGEIVGS